VFLVKVTRNRRMGSTWVCALGALRVAVVCFTLMTLKSKSLTLLEIISVGVSGGK
jgi:hypothetical protein